MSKTIGLVGAGPGLGQAVARRYAQEGYTVVSIARHPETLDSLAAELARAGTTTHTIAADLSDRNALPSLIQEIRAKVGSLDTLFYAPSVRGYIPVLDLTAEPLRELMQLALYSFVDLAHEFVPDMLSRKEGAILLAGASSAIEGMPSLAGTAVLAAQRNYSQALQAKVSGSGVFVGRLYIGAVIEHSAFHAQQLGAKAAGKPVLDLPSVDPAYLADLLWSNQSSLKEHEMVYPAKCPDAEKARA